MSRNPDQDGSKNIFNLVKQFLGTEKLGEPNCKILKFTVFFSFLIPAHTEIFLWGEGETSVKLDRIFGHQQYHLKVSVPNTVVYF